MRLFIMYLLTVHDGTNIVGTKIEPSINLLVLQQGLFHLLNSDHLQPCNMQSKTECRKDLVARLMILAKRRRGYPGVRKICWHSLAVAMVFVLFSIRSCNPLEGNLPSANTSLRKVG